MIFHTVLPEQWQILRWICFQRRQHCVVLHSFWIGIYSIRKEFASKGRKFLPFFRSSMVCRKASRKIQNISHLQTKADILAYEPAHDKTYNKSCATSKDWDQSAHPRSLIKVFANRMYLIQSSKRNKREPLLNWVSVQADLSLLVIKI